MNARKPLKAETLRIDVLRYFHSLNYFEEGLSLWQQLPEHFTSLPEFKTLELELLYSSVNFSSVVQAETKLLIKGLKTESVFERILLNPLKKLIGHPLPSIP